jgi:hypothetical protein
MTEREHITKTLERLITNPGKEVPTYTDWTLTNDATKQKLVLSFDRKAAISFMVSTIMILRGSSPGNKEQTLLTAALRMHRFSHEFI